ncbi:thermonuclease family protein [Leptolyngbya sp. 15MV]|nr:thermonuclease family protein [Leptolyngbya sp. 15MV]
MRPPANPARFTTAELQRILNGVVLTCQPVALDQFRRIVARCSLEDGLDVAEELVERGWALAFRRFSDAYIAAEDRARTQRRGIWAGEFTAPDIYRARR